MPRLWVQVVESIEAEIVGTTELISSEVASARELFAENLRQVFVKLNNLGLKPHHIKRGNIRRC
jgi:hypothetical protein